MDIHNTLEVVDTMDATAAAIKAAKADGNVNWMDTPKFVAVIPLARKALQDSEQIKLELQDVDSKEAQILFDRLFKAATALMDAVLTAPTKK